MTKMEDKELFGEPSHGLTIKEHVLKYLSYYPLFIISIIICVGAGLVYLRYATPKYLATTLLFVKNDNSGNSNDLIETALTGAQPRSNLENEIQLMRSGTLMERVVSKHGFHVSYYHVGKVRETDLYLDAPFRLLPQTVKDSNNQMTITLKNLSNSGGIIESGPDDKKITKSFKWNSIITMGKKTFSLVKHGDLTNDPNEYIATWKPVGRAASEISANLGINLLDKKTSILSLSFLTENLNRGKDILNALVAEYDLSDIEERNVVTQNTIRFINDRLRVVSEDLSGVEGNLESYQGSKGLVDVNIQSNQSFENTNSIAKEIADINLKQAVAKSIMDYFNNPGEDDNLVPSTLGLQDATLASLINNYNELQLRKQKEAPSLAKNGIVMSNMNNQLEAIKGSIIESLQNINRNLQQTERGLEQQRSKYNQFISALPRNERAMQEIKRKQSITEGLYLYLLQRREESAVSSTSSNVSNYKQIEPAKGFGPVEPDRRNIQMYSALLGFLLPFGIIYIRDVLNDKIKSRKDITAKLKIPIIGEVGHVTKKESRGVSVMQRDILGEQFRIIRTNLYFLMEQKEKQVILVTSSTGSEGKSFISLNLAAVLAIPGKKVALLEFDMRKPGILSRLDLRVEKGLSNYFSGDVETPFSLYHRLEELIPSLHIYPSGKAPTYPGDLFISEKVQVLFEELKAEYDYIVIDSAPVGLVSDAMILGQHADIALFIIRQRFTLKKQLEFINDLIQAKKLSNVGCVFNDVKTGGKLGYYGYGHSTNKSYGYKVRNDASETIKKSEVA